MDQASNRSPRGTDRPARCRRKRRRHLGAVADGVVDQQKVDVVLTIDALGSFFAILEDRIGGARMEKQKKASKHLVSPRKRTFVQLKLRAFPSDHAGFPCTDLVELSYHARARRCSDS